MRAGPGISAMAALVLGIATACAGSAPSGAACSDSSQCETGLACLYALGAGCSASGQCVVPSSDCSGPTGDLSLCGCSGAVLDLTCIPSIAALPQRTATGPACAVDAGTDGGDAGR
jgi:hypothetical protein